MKKLTVKIGLALLGSVALGTLITACSSLVGTNPGPPSGVEKLLYNTTTNYAPILQVVTNYQVVTLFQTNVIPIGVNAFQTNIVTVQQTNAVMATVTNQQAQYTETLKPGVGTAVQAGGGILNTLFPGVGAIATQAVLALFGAWGYMRSTKLGTTSNALAQEIEAIRTFVQTLPNGAAYDAAFVNFMQAHQTDAGVIQQVATILDNAVKNPDAQAAASQISQFIQQLQASVGPAPTTPTPITPKVG